MARRLWIASVSLAFCLGASATAQAGAIFVTGHDPIWHANFGGNPAGAANLARAGIDYARQGSSAKFLFIEAKTAPVPSGNAYTAGFLTSALSYAPGSYDVMDAADLNALPDFGATLAGYSAIVVASDHGGMLTAAELQFLNSNANVLVNYLNAGGGLYAEAESNAVGSIGSTPPFGFLPFLVSSTSFQSPETANTVTPLGLALGLTNADVNGNFSHNFFASTGGMTPVDFFNGDPSRPLTLAYTGQIGSGGVVPEPASLALGVVALLGIGLARRCRG
jgi:hypothetical protein